MKFSTAAFLLFLPAVSGFVPGALPFSQRVSTCYFCVSFENFIYAYCTYSVDPAQLTLVSRLLLMAYDL